MFFKLAYCVLSNKSKWRMGRMVQKQFYSDHFVCICIPTLWIKRLKVLPSKDVTYLWIIVWRFMSELFCLEHRKEAVELWKWSGLQHTLVCSLCYFLDLNSQRPSCSGLSGLKNRVKDVLICTMLMSVFITITAKLSKIIYFNHL